MVGVRYFVHDKWLIFNIVLKLWADVKYHVPTGLVFRRRRAVFILLAMPPPSLGRAALALWCGWFKPQLEIRHATTLTTGAKHWHRQKAVFYVFVSVPLSHGFPTNPPKNVYPICRFWVHINPNVYPILRFRVHIGGFYGRLVDKIGGFV